MQTESGRWLSTPTTKPPNKYSSTGFAGSMPNVSAMMRKKKRVDLLVSAPWELWKEPSVESFIRIGKDVYGVYNSKWMSHLLQGWSLHIPHVDSLFICLGGVLRDDGHFAMMWMSPLGFPAFLSSWRHCSKFQWNFIEISPVQGEAKWNTKGIQKFQNFIKMSLKLCWY